MDARLVAAATSSSLLLPCAQNSGGVRNFSLLQTIRFQMGHRTRAVRAYSRQLSILFASTWFLLLLPLTRSHLVSKVLAAGHGFHQVRTEAMNSFLSTSSFAVLLWKREAKRTLLLLSLALALPSWWEICGERNAREKGELEAALLLEEWEGEGRAYSSHSFGHGPAKDFLHIGYS